jgi:hypothetical protein
MSFEALIFSLLVAKPLRCKCLTLQGDLKLSPIMDVYNYLICLRMRDYNKMQFKIIFAMTQYG